MLWIVIAAMSGGALALLLPPLLRRPAAAKNRAAFDMEVYRDQLTEIGRDLERGLITGREAEDALTEIGRRLLAADRQMETDAAGESTAPTRTARAWFSAAAVAVAVPAGAVALYLAVGAPHLADRVKRIQPMVASQDGARDEKMVALVEELGSKLRDRPDDARGWSLYARTLASLGRIDAAVDAFRRAVALAPRDVALSSRFAETLILRAGGTVTPEARGLFEAVLALDADQPRARYYLGLADQQAGQRHKALARWLALEADSPVGAPWKALLKSRIERLAKDTGIDGAALAAMRNEAAKRPAPDQPGAMIHAMVDRLAARLEKDPDDAEGWRRLARSYRVLGKPAMSRDALARAAALLPDDVDVLSDYAAAIVAAAVGKDGLPPEMMRVTGEILKRNPDHPSALWYAGIIRTQADDSAGALVHWRRLRTLLKPGTQQHQDVSRRIEALEKSARP